MYIIHLAVVDLGFFSIRVLVDLGFYVGVPKFKHYEINP
jgi:hypothetical protein